MDRIGGIMEGVISYRPKLGKNKLKKLAIQRLHYRNINQFIDHAVSKALRDELGTNPKAQKMVEEVVETIYRHMPLKFVKPTPKEASEIRAKAGEVLSGKVKSIPAEELLKKHHGISGEELRLERYKARKLVKA